MKDASTVRRSARARYNQLRKSAEELQAFLTTDFDALDQATMADLRSTVEDITQRFHEFNAYRNAGQAIGAIPEDEPVVSERAAPETER